MGINRTPTKSHSKSTSKFLPVYDLLTVSSLSKFDNLNSNKLIELFRELQKSDPELASFEGKVTEKNYRELWKNVFENQHFTESHPVFAETNIQPRNLIPKASYNDEKFLARTSSIVSKNANDIIHTFSKSSKKDKPEVSSDTDEENSVIEDKDPCKAPNSKVNNLDQWFEQVQKSQAKFMEESINNFRTQMFSKLQDNSNKISSNASEIEKIKKDIVSGAKHFENVNQQMHSLKKDKEEQDEKLKILQQQVNTILEFKENGETFAGNNTFSEIDEFTRASWYQQFILATRKFSKNVISSENLGYIQIDIQREFTEQLIYKEQNTEIPKFNLLNFKKITGVDVEIIKVWQKTSQKYAALGKVVAPLVRRAQITRDLIDRRARYKGKFGLGISIAEEYKIDAFLQFLTRWLDPTTNEALITGFDKTKRGFPFVYLNDVTNEKRDEFFRNKGREPKDEEVATRVFIPCPIEFSKLTQNMLNIENLKKLGARTHFCFNDGIWKRPDSTSRSQN